MSTSAALSHIYWQQCSDLLQSRYIQVWHIGALCIENDGGLVIAHSN